LVVSEPKASGQRHDNTQGGGGETGGKTKELRWRGRAEKYRKAK